MNAHEVKELETMLQKYKISQQQPEADENDDECLYPPPPGSFTVE